MLSAYSTELAFANFPWYDVAVNAQMDDLLLNQLDAHNWVGQPLLTIGLPIRALNDPEPERVMQVVRKRGWCCTIWMRSPTWSTLLISKYEPDPPEPPRLRAVRKKP